jgi:hypothetical protein
MMKKTVNKITKNILIPYLIGKGFFYFKIYLYIINMSDLICNKCGKTGYKTKKSLISHQKRSKLCNSIKQLPKQESDLEKQLEKNGIILVNKD